MLALLSAAGWLIARTPEFALRGVAVVLGEIILWTGIGRRRLMLSNLHHAFPERTAGWRLRTARASSRRLVETGLLSLATPHLPEARIRRIARLAPSADQWARARGSVGKPVVFATLHLALWESQTWLPLLSPAPLPEFGIIFRPLDSDAADAYVKKTRERFGMRLLSRKEGFAQALRILRAGGCVGILFDQNAGDQGALSLLFGRVCSTTELPGMLASHTGAELRTFYPRRTGFWRVAFESHPVPHDGTAAGMTVGLNGWLESALAADDELCASWLWAHNRWRNQDVPARRLRLEAKRSVLAEDLRLRGLPALPRRTRVWVRLPNWLGDVVMCLPLLRALRLSRPDAEITLVGREAFRPLIDRCRCADAFQPLPPPGAARWLAVRCWRARFPDVWLAFTNSFRGDLEGWLAGAPQRFGIRRPGRARPLLTHAYAVPAGFREDESHQADLWEAYLRRFGLTVPVSRAPIGAEPEPPRGAPVGLIAGSENEPAKRWPVAGWRRLIDAFPNQRFILFGTAADRPIAAAVAQGYAADRVEDLAGKTDLAAFMKRLEQCRMIVTNDTGGMHLANALGRPVIALFGPTNPVRTGPIFAAPRVLLQPPGCAPRGGAPLERLAPESVIAAARTWVDARAGQPERPMQCLS